MAANGGYPIIKYATGTKITPVITRLNPRVLYGVFVAIPPLVNVL